MPRGRDDRPVRGDDGFTLMEVLAAVAVAGFLLAAIGSIVGVTIAGLRSSADRVALAEAARTLLDGLPRGDGLKLGTTTGTFGATLWRVEVAPAPSPAVVHPAGDAENVPRWTPATIRMTTTARSGRSLRIDTIGLLRASTP